jgi:hypothetical protein
MRCSKARNWLSLAVDAQLSPDRTLSLDKHLESCDECRAYQRDLQLGKRLLKVSTPRLSENFEWRLQLKLNQLLQRAAGDAALPWSLAPEAKGRWWRTVGLSSAAGFAAVLVLGLGLLPPQTQQSGLSVDPAATWTGRSAAASDSQPLDLGYNDRLPFSSGRTSPFQRSWRGTPVANRPTGFTGAGFQQPRSRLGDEVSWSLATVNRLREENQQLRGLLLDTQRQLLLVKAQLDTSRIVIQHLQREER